MKVAFPALTKPKMSLRLVTLFAAVAAASDEVDVRPSLTERRGLGIFGARKYEASVRGVNGFAVKVTAEDKGFTQWTVDVQNEGSAQCNKGYNWHIHVGRVGSGDLPAACGPGETGGHADDSLACGGATDNSAQCASIYSSTDCAGSTPKCWSAQYAARCGPGAKQKGCEYGDLSGKMGAIPNGAQTTEYFDGYIQDLSTYKRASIVLHCCNEVNGVKNCSERIACGNIYKKWR